MSSQFFKDSVGLLIRCHIADIEELSEEVKGFTFDARFPESYTWEVNSVTVDDAILES